MPANTDQPSTLADYLISCRNQCLDVYVTTLHAQGMPFAQEDGLIVRVRGGTILDNIASNLRKNEIDNLSSFFAENARQLLASGYNFDQIRLMYDLLEQSVLEIIRPLSQQALDFTMALHSLKSAFQLAKVIGVNQYMTQLNNRVPAFTPPPQMPPDPSRYRLVAQPPQPPSAPPRPTLRSNQSGPLSRPAQSDGQNSDFTSRSNTVFGYLEWPLKAVTGSQPPEYYASLQDGSTVHVLLVDNPMMYTRQGVLGNKQLSCRIRRVGPVALAYPI